MAVIVDESDFYSSTTKLRITLLLSVVLFLLIISLLITFITKKMFKPLFSITVNISEIAAGTTEIANTMEKVKDMTIRIDETADALKIEVDKFKI